MDELDKNEFLGDLYAYYGQLLTKGQQAYFEDYYYNDLSLGEIATNYHVSRQAVYDNLRRCRKLLNNYEAKLHLNKDYQQIEHKLTVAASAIEQQQAKQALQEINEILSKIRGE
ncbi:YlxM family DNA-binding protein [Lactobacillus sp. ESL0684]|uniref:YlxM family DNA-binding protein n=1 Tax=unclassified Lactobacillus TaxID=2620435 RepID=UPI0023F707E3|nr:MULTISPECIES: YlxM family DNA-binding protein [unclassified Lactobacillus]WEV40828.1 YlxM family DNA-binding protein [Lactobacillus sp. ESL0681]WEV44341.1 YlxM family DNA-binding protein [Lactobacillus sp. ESL0684]